jgi:hypothetical protein
MSKIINAKIFLIVFSIILFGYPIFFGKSFLLFFLALSSLFISLYVNFWKDKKYYNDFYEDLIIKKIIEHKILKHKRYEIWFIKKNVMNLKISKSYNFITSIIYFNKNTENILENKINENINKYGYKISICCQSHYEEFMGYPVRDKITYFTIQKI